MKTTQLSTIHVLLSLVLLSSCSKTGKNTPHAQQVENDFVASLTERKIGESSFYISLPANYSLQEEEGPDFSVFYFTPTDTTLQPEFSGGLYFGNFPSKFGPPSDGCKAEVWNGKIFDTSGDWTAYECAGKYSVQTIVESKSGKEWNKWIHAFGRGSSKSEANKIIDIFSTLKKK